MDLNTDRIPESLKHEDRWLNWEFMRRGKKATKVPIYGGKSNDRTTWVPYSVALDRLKRGNGTGIAFALGDGFVGLDFDDCVVDGEINPDIQKIVDTFDTYTEISPSETGIKMICKGEKPGGSCKKDGIEIYEVGRFFTITGHGIKSTQIQERQAQINALYAQVFDRKPTASPALNSMLRIMPEPTENDGSRRMFKLACRAVEHNLTDNEAIATIRKYEEQQPFPKSYEDAEIVTRLRDAEKHAERYEHCTDLGNAKRMVAQFARSLKYIDVWKKWLSFDGCKWDVTEGAATEAAKDTARSISLEAARANGDLTKSLEAWATMSEDAKRVRNMIFLAQSEPALSLRVDQLDADPYLLNCKDGTIDLRTGELREHRREDMLTKCTACGYSTAEPTLWLKFLREVLPQPTIDFLQRVVGSTLIGEVHEHILPILYGPGGNGKGCFTQTIVGMLGDYGSMASDDLLLSSSSHPTAMADLFGKRFVAVNETDEQACLSEARVKNITGGDKIKARRMREDFWEFTPSHTAFLSTNYRPIIHGTDNGIWRRVFLVPFEIIIEKKDQDANLPAKLRAEWPSILHWAVQGCLAWQRDGLNPPEDVRAATKGYAETMDTLGLFIAAECVVGADFDVKAADVYNAYSAWAHNNREQVLSGTAFGLNFVKRFKRDHKRDGNYYFGLKLAS